MTSSGRPDRAIVLGTGSSFEILSNLSRDATRIVLDAPGIRRDADANPVASTEGVAIVRAILKDGNSANVPLRGVGPGIFTLRPEFRIVEGRTFEPSLREVVVGRSAQRQFRACRWAAVSRFAAPTWSVVGVFESSGDQHEAELITGAETLQSAFRRNAFQSVTVQLESSAAFPAFKAWLTDNPALSVDVLRESDYNQQQSRSVTQVLAAVAYLVGGIMALGAMLGALNSMYTAVSGRTVEITLRRPWLRSCAHCGLRFRRALLLALAGESSAPTWRG
jgi:putative ABC transport system permease protein